MSERHGIGVILRFQEINKSHAYVEDGTQSKNWMEI